MNGFVFGFSTLQTCCRKCSHVCLLSSQVPADNPAVELLLICMQSLAILNFHRCCLSSRQGVVPVCMFPRCFTSVLPANLTNTYCYKTFKVLLLWLEGNDVLFHLPFPMTDEAGPLSYVCWSFKFPLLWVAGFLNGFLSLCVLELTFCLLHSAMSYPAVRPWISPSADTRLNLGQHLLERECVTGWAQGLFRRWICLEMRL